MRRTIETIYGVENRARLANSPYMPNDTFPILDLEILRNENEPA